MNFPCALYVLSSCPSYVYFYATYAFLFYPFLYPLLCLSVPCLMSLYGLSLFPPMSSPIPCMLPPMPSFFVSLCNYAPC